MKEKYELSYNMLRKECDPNIFEYDTTENILGSRELIGQKRAMEALKFGLSVKRKGYNIYVSGLTGTGRNSYSYLVAKEFSRNKKSPKDWCYVFNFKRASSPKAISLSPGMGKVFKKDVEKAINNIEIDIPKVLLSKDYEDNKNIIYSQQQEKAEDVIKELNEVAKSYGFVFKQTEKGIFSIPLVEDRIMTDKEVEDLSEEEVEKLKESSNELSKKAFDYVKRIREIENDLQNRITRLKEDKVLEVLVVHLDPLEEKFKENKEVKEYFSNMKEDIVKNFEMFLDDGEGNSIENILLPGNKKEDFFKRYEVNLFIDNKDLEGAPVIREMNPNYYNLLGKIEYVNELGGLRTDHTKICPGSMHEANGGYLIVQAKDILQSKAAWEGFKRAISTEEIMIENITGLNVISETLRPEPIPLDIKVIIIGDYLTYHLLYQYDEEFKKLFKIRADFDVEMERNEENIKKIASFVAYQCKSEGLKPFDRTALAAIIDLSSRISESQNKLTARFNKLVEILYEADAWATGGNKDIVTREDVDRAISNKIYRNNIYEEKLLELIKDETLLVDTEGYKVGEINGLAVVSIGQYAFGKPSKITVNTFLGKEGIVSIERETEQSGNIYDKGVLILSGYLGEKFAKDTQLSITASIAFEQSYDGIDGDSASSTELYGLLSSLGDIPINQGVAVTGSVNQKGVIQPIGGVNEKIEGYYRVCNIKGFKGGEGVIIPHKNLEDLMLNDEVVNAVKNGKFKIYSVKNIDEGIEILTGLKAGTVGEKGTVHYMVKRKLEEYSKLSKDSE